MTTEEIIKMLLSSPVVAALVVGIFGALTIKLGLARFRSERWWERKAAAFAASIEGLHGMCDFHTKYADAFEKGYNLSDGWITVLDEARTRGADELRKGANIGSFVMSKRAGMILNETSIALEAVTPAQPPLDYHAKMRDILSGAIISITAEAKKDLGT